MNALKAYLVKNHGLSEDADEAAVQQKAAELIKSGDLSLADYNKLIAPEPKSASPLEKLGDLIDKAVEKRLANVQISGAAVPTAQQVGNATDQVMQRHFGGNAQQQDSAITPTQVFGKAAGTDGAQTRVNVNSPSRHLDSTKSRLIYPHFTKSGNRAHPNAGQDVTFEGRAAYAQSDLDKAHAGAFLKHRLASMCGKTHTLDDWSKQLAEECIRECEFVGEIWDPIHGKHYIHEPRKLTDIEVKTMLADSTSGGSDIVPYFFEVELVTYPLLNNEFFPLVTLKDIDGTNQIRQGTLGNMTINSGPAEGGSPSITLETTTDLVGVVTWNIFNATGAITFGRDFLTDTPTNVQQTTLDLYKEKLGEWLDDQICNGDGTTEPEGIFNTSNTKTYSFTNSTAGPMKVKDWEGMISAMPLQYRRQGGASIVWAMRDAMWWRIRGISVSDTDQRRIFGYNNEKYNFYEHGVKINESIASSNVAFANLKKYVMYRRKGLGFETSTDGKQLMVDNEMLVVARSRWGGKVQDANAVVLATNASLHS